MARKARTHSDSRAEPMAQKEKGGLLDIEEAPQKQDRLRLAAVCILCQTRLFSKKRNADLEFDLEKRKISVKNSSRDNIATYGTK